MDISDTKLRKEDKIGEIRTDEQDVLSKLNVHNGNAQVTGTRIQCAPPWLTLKLVQEEHDGNLEGSYSPVREEGLPTHANIISSYIVFKIKTEDDKTM